MNVQALNATPEKRLYQVQDEYNEFLKNYTGEAPVALEDYAKAKDELEGGQSRTPAYNGSNWFKDMMASTERFVDPVSRHTAAAGGYLGGLADNVFGTGNRIRNVGHEIGQTLPLDLLENAAFAAAAPFTGGASLAGNVAKGASLANKLRKVVGVGAMASAGARQYAQTDSVGQGVLQAAFLPIGDAAVEKGATLLGNAAAKRFGGSSAFETLAGETSSEVLENVASTLRKGAKPTIAAMSVGGALGGTAANEGQRQLSVLWDQANSSEPYNLSAHNPFTVENIAGNVLGGAMSANLPQTISGVSRAYSLNPILGAKFDKYVSELQTRAKERQTLISTPPPATLTPAERNAYLVRQAKALSASLDPREGAHQDLISFMKNTVPEDGEEAKLRVYTIKDIYDQSWKQMMEARKPKADVFGYKDNVNEKLVGKEAIRQMEQFGYIKVDEQMIEGLMTEVQKNALGTPRPEELQQRVINVLVNKLEASISAAKERMNEDAKLGVGPFKQTGEWEAPVAGGAGGEVYAKDLEGKVVSRKALAAVENAKYGSSKFQEETATKSYSELFNTLEQIKELEGNGLIKFGLPERQGRKGEVLPAQEMVDLEVPETEASGFVKEFVDAPKEKLYEEGEVEGELVDEVDKIPSDEVAPAWEGFEDRDKAVREEEKRLRRLAKQGRTGESSGSVELDPSQGYTRTDQRGTHMKRMKLSDAVTEALKQLSQMDTLSRGKTADTSKRVQARAKSAQFAQDIADWWKAIKPTVDATGKIDPTLKVDLPGKSVWVKDTDGETVKLSLNDLLHTQNVGGRQVFTHGMRKFRGDEYDSRRSIHELDQSGRTVGDLEDEFMKEDWYTPGDTGSMYTDYRDQIIREELSKLEAEQAKLTEGDRMDNEALKKAKLAIVDSSNQVYGLEKELLAKISKLGDPKNNAETWDLLKQVFLKKEEGGVLKPDQRKADKQNLFHLAVPAIIRMGKFAESGSATARAVQALPDEVGKFVDAVRPGWRTEVAPEMQYKYAKKMLRDWVEGAQGNYNEMFDEISGLLTGKILPTYKVREAKVTKGTGKKQANMAILQQMQNQQMQTQLLKDIGLSMDDSSGKVIPHLWKANEEASSAVQAFSLVYDEARKRGFSQENAYTYAKFGAQATSNMISGLHKVSVYRQLVGDEAWDKLPDADKVQMIKGNISNSLGFAAPVSDGFNGSFIGVRGSKKPTTTTRDAHLVVRNMLNTLVHELTHNVEQQALGLLPLDTNDPFSVERVEAMRAAMKVSDMMSDTDKKALLQHVAEFVEPAFKTRDRNNPDLNALRDATVLGDVIYGGTAKGASKYEFLTVLSGMMGQGLMSKEKYKVLPENLHYFAPNEISLYTKGIARDAAYNLEMLQGVMDELGLGDLKSQLSELIPAMKKVVQSREVEVADTALRAIEQRLVSGAVGVDGLVPQAMIYKVDGVGGLPFRESKENSSLAEFAKALAGPDKNVKLNYYWKNFVPAMQVLDKMRRQGVSLANDVQAAISELAPNRNRLETAALRPFLTGATKDNNLVLEKDSPIVKAHRDPKIYKALNRLFTHQNTTETAFFDKLPDGSFVLNQKNAQEFERIMSSIPTEKHELVIRALQDWRRVNENLAQIQIESKKRNAIAQTAQRIMLVTKRNRDQNPGIVEPTWDQAYATATQLFNAAWNNDVQMWNGASKNLGQELTEEIQKSLFGDVNGEKGTSRIAMLKGLERTLQSRAPWHMTQQRHGRYLVVSRDATGMVYVDGAETARHAAKVQEELEQKGHHSVRVLDKYSEHNRQSFTAPEHALEYYTDVADAAYSKMLTENAGAFDAETLELLQAFSPGQEIKDTVTTKGLNRMLKKRKAVPAGLGHDYLKYQLQNINAVSEAVSRRDLTDRVRLIFADPRARGQDDFRVLVENHVNGMMAPNPDGWRTTKALTSAYYLGLNISSMIVEGMQTVQTLLPALIARDNLPGSSLKRNFGIFGSALKDVVEMKGWGKKSSEEITQLEVIAHEKLRNGDKLTKEEELAYFYRKAFHEGELTHSALSDAAFAGDQQAVMKQAFTREDEKAPDKFALLQDKAYLGATHALRLYSTVSNFNNKVAFLAGLRHGQAQGLSGEELYNHARNLKHLSMFGGGKANQPLYVTNFSNHNTRAAWSAYHTLQQYGMALVGHYAQMMSESLPETLGGAKVPPGVKLQARKALATTLAVQLGTAGAMGIPFLGTALTAVENVTGVDADQEMREWLMKAGELTGFGESFADVASNGVVNHLTGLDVGSRLGLGGFLGTSYYNGFSIKDLAGPMFGIVENVYKAAGQARNGDILKATHSLTPNGLKGSANQIINQAKYGDSNIRDSANRLIYTPSGWEVAGMSVGFKPYELTKRANLGKQLVQNRDRAAQQHDAELASLARAWRQGDRQQAMDYARARVQTYGGGFKTYRSTLNQISDLAARMDTMRDYTIGETEASSAGDREIYAGYSPEVVLGAGNRAAAVNRHKNTGTGYSPSRQYLSRQQMLDTLMSQGLSRTEAMAYIRRSGL